MKILKSLLTGLIGMAAIFLIANAVYADETNPDQPTYFNGGIGQEEADDMRLHARDYNLRLYFSEGKKGQSITDVAVTITDKKGNIKLEVEDAGPMLFVQLTNGTYKVVSQHNGVMKTQTVKIVNRKGVNVYLNWKNSMADESEEIYDDAVSQ
ncbi:MAG: hypothetical protein PSV17_01395 [Methylotenera sp.]|uniref:hypothetical protein n=1 Tax=Methylotenera sp. TaxID=2051956 RepID=UPI002486EFA5|nr:hypothetical protein [Methylotenera sp.]MDI1308074.1 hypothetical protein [Methylotenera sp.]